jgi:ATP-dependent DNA helicase DinG
MRHFVPRAVIALRQGFGRLIRSRADRGVVVIFDRRIVTKRYGAVFLASLPEARRTRQLAHVATFLGLEPPSPDPFS